MPLTLTPRTPGALTITAGLSAQTTVGVTQLPMLFSDLSSGSTAALTLATRATGTLTVATRAVGSLTLSPR